MDWLWLVGGAVVLLALLLLLNSRPELMRSLPFINYGGKQGADVNAIRVLEDEVTKSAGVQTPKDPAP
jgi:hypothetical protein